ncbi:glycoside hydrolase family 20 protein [Xylariaceae sp. FL0016]|nr:glycoside hydrolase family 20 protein [Xylariaceae sp. FL0016]
MYIKFNFLALVVGAMSFQLLPPAPVESSASNETTAGGLVLEDLPATVYITTQLASQRDSQGLTLIPPSGQEFAEVFLEDLTNVTSRQWELQVVETLPTNVSGIFLDQYAGDASTLTYEDGTPTEEAYALSIAVGRATISGTGSRGMWWGTRTLLQMMMTASDGTMPTARTVDAPAYATRGFMLDAGRKWYAPSFLKELCTYAAFFKLSEFHYHTSDNYPLNRGRNATWQDVYAQFSLRPESRDLQGLVQRPEQTLSRADFADLQAHCARRGITVVPEIEAPGHCLSITKWRPELALPDKRDLLNLTHPEAVPTVRAIWAEFLPWFASKEVHIGADEYDAALADDYIDFVNGMAAWVSETTAGEKRVRIWGTYEPSDDRAISKEVVVQHWQYGQSDPVALQAEGYDVVNSEDWWAYMSLKNDHTPILPAPYPQFFNESRVLNFAGRGGWQWTPALFNPENVTEQLADGARGNKGAILAAWNDNGPDATTQLEAYYAMRRGIPLVGARAWSGGRGPRVDVGTVDASIDFLSAQAPGQNLDRRLVVSGMTNGTATNDTMAWTRGSEEAEEETVVLGYGSKGMNYTLTLSVTGPFTLSSEDATLSLNTSGSLVFAADGFEYPLRSVAETDGFDPGHPGRIWANASTSSHEPVTVSMPAEITITGDVIGGARVWVDGTFRGRFEVFVYGGKNTVFSWSQMAFVAPLQSVTGGIHAVKVMDGVVKPESGGQTVVSGGGGESMRGGGVGRSWMSVFWAGLMGLMVF